MVLAACIPRANGSRAEYFLLVYRVSSVLSRQFSSGTGFTTMAVAEKDRVFRHFLGTIVYHEWSIPA
jgi:hypothetical protein